MTYKVFLSKTAYKTYSKLPPKLRKGIDRCLDYLKDDPRHNPNAKGLKGIADSYRCQVGGWRVIYEVDDEAKEVRIYQIRPRGDVYKH
jgi:mRNA interferase RelE/StbE